MCENPGTMKNVSILDFKLNENIVLYKVMSVPEYKDFVLYLFDKRHPRLKFEIQGTSTSSGTFILETICTRDSHALVVIAQTIPGKSLVLSPMSIIRKINKVTKKKIERYGDRA